MIFLLIQILPFQVEKQIGERRKISFHGVGLSVGPEMNFKQVTSHCKENEEVSSGHEVLYFLLGSRLSLQKSFPIFTE
jgi:glycerol-3-phosphate O-acyltransferase